MKFKPDVIIGFGSYTSVPPIAGGFLSRLKMAVILHEQNVLPGKANKLLSHFADKVALSFDATKVYFKEKGIHTGNFVNEAFFNKKKKEALKCLNFTDKKQTLLVMGGSQGAQSVNLIFIRTLELLEKSVLSNLQVIHICGEKHYEMMSNEYKKRRLNDCRLIGFTDEMPTMIAASDLIISRAGATSIAEICAAAKPAVFIPYPYAANHQMFNSRVLEDSRAAVVLAEGTISAEMLTATIKGLLADKRQLRKMAEASRKFADSQAPNKMKNLIRQCYENIK